MIKVKELFGKNRFLLLSFEYRPTIKVTDLLLDFSQISKALSVAKQATFD